METKRTVHIHAVLEVKLPLGIRTETLHLGLAGSKILDNYRVIEEAELSTWWVDEVRACNSRYVNCPHCQKIEMVCNNAVILDGKPLCIHCSAEFVHGDMPRPRTKAEIDEQLKGMRSPAAPKENL